MYKIAIVDDNWEICELFKVMLENLEIFEVISFDNGQLFMDYLLDKNGMDVAIIDLDLPDVSGYDIIGYLRRNFSASLPVIVITAFNDFNHKIKALELGADDYIVKPVNMFEVVLKINNFMKKKKFIEEILSREEIIKEKAEMLSVFEEFIKDEILLPLENHLDSIKGLKLHKEPEPKVLNFLDELDNKLKDTSVKIDNILKLYQDKKQAIDSRKKDLQSISEIEEIFNTNMKNNVFKNYDGKKI